MIRIKISALIASFILLALSSELSLAQSIGGGTQTDGRRVNSISTAVPFLLIAPDSRGGAMGDAGVASPPDVNSMHWNPAKYAFVNGEAGFGLAYSPWLKQLVDDINLAYLTGYKRISDIETIAGSVRFFSLGDITFTDSQGNDIQQFNPSEFAVDLGYIRQLSDFFSVAIAARYINSNLGSGNFNNTEIQPGNSVAADLAFYYNRDVFIGNSDVNLAYGLHISNIGTKMQYGTKKDFIPTNLRVGFSPTIRLDDFNQVGFSVDLNKLLVPTQPLRDSTGNITAGRDPDRSVVSGIFGSFSDAPGGFKEEIREVSLSFGAEYVYDQQFALRAGYFYEDPTKGNRQYFTVGAGLRYTTLNFDFAYLIPGKQQNPLEKTLRFSLLFNVNNPR